MPKTKVVKDSRHPNPKTAPGIKYGGRKKGTPNKVTHDIRLLAQRHGPACIEGLAKLMSHKTVAFRLAAYRELLDRGYGKAPQHVQGELGTTINILLAQWAQPVTVAPGDDAKLVNGSGGNGAGHSTSE